MKYKILILYIFLCVYSVALSQSNTYTIMEKKFNEMTNNSDLKIEFNNKIFQQINKYKSEHNLNKVLSVFRFYKPMFANKFNKYNVPNELKYLSIIESRLNISTVSNVGAVGMWQIMPETGKELNLRKDHLVNDWLNPIASTDASAKYLSNAYKKLDNWNLALVSYNCGIGNVQKAIKKSGSKNIWNVYEFLPKETRDYIIRFYAMMYVDNYANSLNIYPQKMKYNYNNVGTLFYNGNDKIIKNNWFYFLNPHILTDYIPKNTPINYIK